MTQSNAIRSAGWKIYRATSQATSEPAYEEIAEVLTISGPNLTKDVIDVTTLSATDLYRMYISGFRDGGEVTFEFNYTDSGYEALMDDIETDDYKEFKIATPSASREFEFDGIVTAVSLDRPTTEQTKGSATIKISGAPRITS